MTIRKKRSLKNIIFCVMAIIVIIAGGITVGVIRIHSMNSVSQESKAFIEKLGVGYNIGNSLDACDWSKPFDNAYGNDTEIYWGSPKISNEFIKSLSDAGFNTVRIPVTYMNHIDEKGDVDDKWLMRVSEVVDMIISNKMYCIIDIHHDTGNEGWIRASKGNYSNNQERVEKLITQIATHFINYDEHLIFEGFNEMVDEECHWQHAPLQSLKALDKWNQLFVDTVRSTGGNNSNRYLLINTYAATVDAVNISYFEMPSDSAKDKLIAGVHNYSGPQKLEKSFKTINKLSKRGFPVIIGEFGSTVNAGYDRAEHAKQFIKLCRQYGYCPIWWDNGQDPDKHPESSFALFNRETCEIYFPEIIKAITDK